jgi:hypothetical protein
LLTHTLQVQISSMRECVTLASTSRHCF